MKVAWPGFGLEQGCVAGDVDAFRCGADLQLNVDCCALSNLNADPFLNELFEALHFDGDVVETSREIGRGEVAGFGGFGLELDPSALVDDQDLGIGDERPAWVLNAARDLAAVALGEEGGKEQDKRN